MALDRIKFNIASFNDADAGGNNYYAGIVYEIFNSNDTLADIYSDAAGANPINQDGISNKSNSSGEVAFYIANGSYYIKVNGKTEVFGANGSDGVNSKYNPLTVQDAIDYDGWDVNGGEIVSIQGYYTAGVGGGRWKTIIAGTTDYVDKPDGFGIVQCVGVPNLALKLVVDGWLNVKSYGLRGDRVTDDSAAEANLSASPYLFQYWSAGVYRTNLSNGTSNRTYLFADGAIIDGVIHITGTGPATAPPQSPVTWVDNVRMIGTATATVRFGTFYTRKLNVDKIRITENSSDYVNQTAGGGSRGCHFYFGTKQMNVGEIIIDSSSQYYCFAMDQSAIQGVDELSEDNKIGKITINSTDTTGLVTAKTVNLTIDEIIIKEGGGDNVSWISNDDIGLKVGSFTLDATGAGNNQQGIYLQNTDPLSSAEFGSIYIENQPGTAFQTYNVGTCHIGKFVGRSNRTHLRGQSTVTCDYFDGDGSIENGIDFTDSFASGSYIKKAIVKGTTGSGVQVGSPNITIDDLRVDGFSFYGLHLVSAGISNFNNKYLESSNCNQGFRCLSAGPVNMGVMNLHDNNVGLQGANLADFGFDYVMYDNNGTNSNVAPELSAGFRGKKVRQSVSVDRGDNSVSLEVGIDAVTQRFATPLTANRTVTFTTANAQNGDKFRISRNGGGAFNLGISGTFNDKTLTVAGWRDYEFQGAGWHLTGAGDY